MKNEGKLKDRLKELRKSSGMTQEELACKLKIVRSAVANYETNRTSPDISTLILIADIFNVSTDFLLGRTNFKESKPCTIFKEPEIELYLEIDSLSDDSKKEIRKLIKLYSLRDSHS